MPTRTERGIKKPVHLRVDLVERTCALLEEAGFILVNVSSSGESFYYRLPYCESQLRVSLHGRKGIAYHPNGHLTVASVAFGGGTGSNANPPVPFDSIPMSEDKFMQMVAFAVGQYVLRTGALRRT